MPNGRFVMDMEFSPEDLAFQQEVRQFIAENYPAELRGKQDEGEELSKEDFLAWHKILYKKGWIAPAWPVRSEEHTSELQSLMRISYAVFCLKKKTIKNMKLQHH